MNNREALIMEIEELEICSTDTSTSAIYPYEPGDTSFDFNIE